MLEDVQGRLDDRQLPIGRVGISGLRYPVTVWDRENGSQATVAEVMREDSKRDVARTQALVDACFKSNDYEEGRKAFMEKRKPAFTGS